MTHRPSKSVLFFLVLPCLLLIAPVSLAGTPRQKSVKAAKKGEAKTPERSVEELRLETLARSSGKDSLYYIKGNVYAYIPGQRPMKLFGIEGYNIRKRVETPEKDGFFVATREILFYTDPKSGAILSQWDNPFTKQKNEVFDIYNDPVNFRLRKKDGKYVAVSMDGTREFGEAEPPQEWDDYYVWTSDVFPFYPLPGWEKNYTASEMFDFYVPKEDLNKENPRVMNSWTRVGPWLPWMGMDGHEGLLVYHARSYLYDSWDRLPMHVKNYVKEKHPTYVAAPSTVDPKKPNATSWSVYMEEMKKRKESNQK